MKFPKRQYVRSKRLLVAYRLIPCQHCGAQDGTVVAAHGWGAGRGGAVKADDNKCASLCFACHSELDQGRLWSKSQRKAIWEAAHLRSVAKLVESGLWPKDIPVPTPWQ